MQIEAKKEAIFQEFFQSYQRYQDEKNYRLHIKQLKLQKYQKSPSPLLTFYPFIITKGFFSILKAFCFYVVIKPSIYPAGRFVGFFPFTRNSLIIYTANISKLFNSQSTFFKFIFKSRTFLRLLDVANRQVAKVDTYVSAVGNSFIKEK